MRRYPRDEHKRSPSGFTLIELLVVIAIIGLIISLILVAAADGVRRAEERATQTIITKLETGVADRLDALLNATAPVNQTHRYLAAINFLASGNYIPVGSVSSGGSDERRAQVIAQYDYLRSELPDVFYLNSATTDGAAFSAFYPLNFAASAFPVGGTSLSNYVVPLGIGFVRDPNIASPTAPYTTAGGLFEGYGDSSTNITNPYPNDNNQLSVTGMFGASFAAAGGVYKNLYAAAASDLITANSGTTVNVTQAFDGGDNNANGFIDELSEVLVNGSPAGASFLSAVNARLALHTHKTARAEMLYAVLVEGVGPLGSVFNRDEFTAREVADTDGDGLPEFVDAWGEPLQFFRLPIYYGAVPGSSDTQKGSAPYNGYSETRQLDPLDPNQYLVSPGWWTALANPGFTTAPTAHPYGPTFTAPDGSLPGQSKGALGFMHYFGILVDPVTSPVASPTPPAGTGWDRTGVYDRRAYFSKFLILSSGPDKEPGVAQFSKDYSALTADSSGSNFTFPIAPATTIQANTQALILIENQASQSNPIARLNAATSGHFFEIPDASSGTTVYLQTDAGLDDITNHNTSAPSTGVR